MAHRRHHNVIHRRCSARSGHDTSHSETLCDVDGGIVRGLHVHEELVPCVLTGGGVEWFEKAERFRGDPLDDDAELFHWLGEGGLEGDRMVKR